MATPTAIFILRQIIDERVEAAAHEKVTAQDVAERWMAHHKIRPLLPSDPTICRWIHAEVVQKARLEMHRRKDSRGSRLILSPIAVGPVRGPRGYIRREAMPVGEHIDLGNHQIKTHTRGLTEGRSRVTIGGQAISLGKSMADPLGELAAQVSAEEDSSND